MTKNSVPRRSKNRPVSIHQFSPGMVSTIRKSGGNVSKIRRGCIRTRKGYRWGAGIGEDGILSCCMVRSAFLVLVNETDSGTAVWVPLRHSRWALALLYPGDVPRHSRVAIVDVPPHTARAQDVVAFRTGQSSLLPCIRVLFLLVGSPSCPDGDHRNLVSVSP